MKAIQGYHLIKPEDLFWRPSNLMRIPNADFLERTGSENLGARLWRMPPKSANTLHKHIRQEEFYFVLEGTGRLRVGDETLTIPKYGGVLVGPDQLRQVFNDTEEETLWLIVGAPEELEFLLGSKSPMDLSLIYPVDPTQLPKELEGVEWPPRVDCRLRRACSNSPMPHAYPTLIPGLRSPFDQVGGIVYFGRMLDKIRLSAAGKLPEAWQARRGAASKGSFDWRCCEFLKIDYPALEAETLKGGTDDELLGWAFAHGRRPDEQEIEIWNGFMTKRGWRDSGTPVLHERLAEIGLPLDTVETMFEFLDLDEGRRELP